MRATALEVADERAMVELRPCWLARLLGAKTVQIELYWNANRFGAGVWLAVNTGTELRLLPYSELILRALDFRPVASLPAATARERTPGGGAIR